MSRRIFIIVLVVILGIVLLSSFSSYNRFVALDEQVNSSWAQVENVLQRRMDLIPNLVQTVKGYANFEQETLTQVIQARAQATQTKVDAGQMTDNPQQMQKYLNAQNSLSSSLGRLMVVVERYPELKANQNFLRLQDELAGTENRIAVERRRYNEAVRAFNQKIRTFPSNIFAGLFGFEQRPYFEAPEEAQTVPQVDFGTD
ncbi:MAG: LemA family protein [candidate division KSB1 bacterium]|nr:LemA family protein [candidate division KSB1 bacterium]